MATAGCLADLLRAAAQTHQHAQRQAQLSAAVLPPPAPEQPTGCAACTGLTSVHFQLVSLLLSASLLGSLIV